jgi:hypothetical protein
MAHASVVDAAAFRNAAVMGQLGVDPAQAETVLNKIRTGKDAVENLIRQAPTLGAGARLGDNPVGHAMAQKFAERVDGGADSYTQALRNLHAQYDDAEQAIVAAMRNYHQIDQASADSFRPHG